MITSLDPLRMCSWGENRKGSHPEEPCGDGEWLVLSSCSDEECPSHEQLICEPHFRMFTKDAGIFKCGGPGGGVGYCDRYGIVFAAWNIDTDAIEQGGNWKKLRKR